MVVDFHVHTSVYEQPTQSLEGLVQKAWGERKEWMEKTYTDPLAFLELMDQSGIDYAVILAELAPITTGIASNEYVARFCAASERLIPFASVNPLTMVNPAGQFENLVRSHGFKGLKLYPTYQQYYPNDARLYPIYAKAQELGVPVSLHTGSSVLAGSRLKYGDPILLDDVAVDFPELTLLMCHCGRPFWYDKAFGLARFHPNLYMEVSGLPPHKLLEFFPELERLADKVVYGSDWPTVPTIKENIHAVRDLKIAEPSKRKILGENAAKLLGLEP
ncbi:MAG: amidohydrolase family protein [Proteobacteria bacterium]|nr:amidohydrolase family protein [Pseudomonadota bacterium]MBU1452680.1 amidohydrolase family protein [Pseudomonadota bacterium]MBU2467203.1 amidohydrolase family protein [Pseudomonadota bacterium]MBU2518967.1 amidohydrolase family protein [Pseudomonadota bacterium]